MGLTAHCVYVSRASLALQSDHILLLLLFYSLLGFTKVTRHILFAFFLCFAHATTEGKEAGRASV